MAFDCVVIGAGIQGSCTAYHLAKNNKKTLLLEQFLLPHSRGSSHGQTRIIRKAYKEDFYVHMMEDSYKLWAQLEKEAGVKLYRQTGLLVMGPKNGKDFHLIKNSMQKNNIPTVMLERSDFSQHIPNVQLSNDDAAFVDTTAGVLYADQALKAVQRLVQSHGGVIKDGEEVINIEPGSTVTVTTANGIYHAKSLVITAGPWTSRLLSHIGLKLPLQVLKINVCYWKERVPGTYSISNRFPCFIQLNPKEAAHDIYGLPSNEYPGLMKVCYHRGSETQPDERDRQTDKSDVDAVSCYISRCFPGLIPVPAVLESCMYTIKWFTDYFPKQFKQDFDYAHNIAQNTPDDNFVLDRHPIYNNIVIGAGFSGHGFKFGPVVGKVLYELSTGQQPSHNLSAFSIHRFQDLLKSAL